MHRLKRRRGKRPAPRNTPDPSPSPAVDPAALNEALIGRLKENLILHDPRVEAAFRAVPRHLFLPGLPLEEAYRDEAIPTKRLADGQVVSSSSQPAIMAIMLEQLALEPGQCVLEIGAGTGYNAALIAHIVGETGHVVSIDIDEDIVESAESHLAAAGIGEVEVACGDGFLGYPDAAPYDRIILTAASWDVAPAWREQLKPGGRIVLPLDIKHSQKSVALEAREGYLESVSLTPCGFMALRGMLTRPEQDLILRPGLRFVTDASGPLDPETIYWLLVNPYRDLPVGAQVTSSEIFDGLGLWLGLHEPNLCSLSGEGEQAALVPFLLGVASKWQTTSGILEGDRLCLLMRPPDQAPPADWDGDRRKPFALLVRSYGSDDRLAQRLIDQVDAWVAAGRPGSAGQMRIKVYPAESDYAPAPGEIVISNPWSKLVLEWG
jgi:protein-L-isoaspartate(D-aspartate) O-methyltransferase